MRIALLAPLGWVLLAAAAGNAQVLPERILGEVTAIDTAARQITVKLDSGGSATVALDDRTVYIRVPPGEKDLTKAVKITIADVGIGDRVLARGNPARSVIVMTKADLAHKRERDRAEWQRRGAAGIITALNAETKEITIRERSRQGPKTIVIEPAANVVFRRYAPDSVRFADAKPSSFADLRVGDQLRVLGDTDADGTRIRPEEIVSGAFENIAGTVISVDAAAGEIRIADLATRKPLTVRITADSMLRRMPAPIAAMMARRTQIAGRPAGGAWHPPNGDGQGRPDQAAAPKWPGRAGGNMDLQQALEHMPALDPHELKHGDAIIVSSTTGTDASHVTAIVLVAGVEPLLTAPGGGQRPLGGEWNFDIGMPQ